jgi:hypothetical protein
MMILLYQRGGQGMAYLSRGWRGKCFFLEDGFRTGLEGGELARAEIR